MRRKGGMGSLGVFAGNGGEDAEFLLGICMSIDEEEAGELLSRHRALVYYSYVGSAWLGSYLRFEG